MCLCTYIWAADQQALMSHNMPDLMEGQSPMFSRDFSGGADTAPGAEATEAQILKKCSLPGFYLGNILEHWLSEFGEQYNEAAARQAKILKSPLYSDLRY